MHANVLATYINYTFVLGGEPELSIHRRGDQRNVTIHPGNHVIFNSYNSTTLVAPSGGVVRGTKAFFEVTFEEGGGGDAGFDVG